MAGKLFTSHNTRSVKFGIPEQAATVSTATAKHMGVRSHSTAPRPVFLYALGGVDRIGSVVKVGSTFDLAGRLEQHSLPHRFPRPDTGYACFWPIGVLPKLSGIAIENEVHRWLSVRFRRIDGRCEWYRAVPQAVLPVVDAALAALTFPVPS
jgi:hypothetical protein